MLKKRVKLHQTCIFNKIFPVFNLILVGFGLTIRLIIEVKEKISKCGQAIVLHFDLF